MFVRIKKTCTHFSPFAILKQDTVENIYKNESQIFIDMEFNKDQFFKHLHILHLYTGLKTKAFLPMQYKIG